MPRSSLTECWVGFVFSSPVAPICGSQRDVDVEDVAATDVLAHLADRLEERQRLDVAHRAADLDDDHAVLRQAAAATLPVPSRATRSMRSLISLVMCGMTCTVPPR